MRNKKRFLAVPLVLALSLGNVSCDLIQDCLECMCGSIEDGNSGITGNAEVDSFFAAVIALDTSTASAQASIDSGLDGLREVLELDASANACDIHAAIADAFSTAGVTFDLSVEPAECKADIDVAAQASAECSAEIEPGHVDIRCEGSCEGTCQGSCTGECRLPSFEGYCEGSCHGSCYVDATAECYGTCHGTCSGTCSYEESGECHGSCSGTCTGHCETRIEGSCTGECHGECALTYTPGECNARCEGSCEGHCEGSCEGEVVPPSMSAECEAQVQARVDASVECEPPEVNFGVDTSGVDNIVAITNQLRHLAKAEAEAQVIMEGLDDYMDTFGSAVGALIESPDIPNNKRACALLEMQDALNILTNALATVGLVVDTEVDVLFGTSC